MTRVRLDIRYDGSGYSGWQKQPKTDLPTIQGVLEKALKDLTGQDLSTIGSGRTDAGTHARHQVVHFDFEGPADRYPWVKAINSRLPEEIQVFEAYDAPDEFHALHSAEHKHYIYYICHSPLPPVFRRKYCWWQKHALDEDWLNQTCENILGTHDFKSFQNTGTEVPDTVRSLSRAEWVRTSPHILEFHIEGNGFLKQMVRNIVGTCVSLHRSGADTSELLKILQGKDRSLAGPTAPATGLFLNSVSYALKLDNKCRKI